jgi:hypothetical protein
MKTPQYHLDVLVNLLENRTVATLQDMKTALGTQVTMTVFRKLKAIGYRTSYTHRARYYALEQTIQFNEQGLWSFNDIWFSKYATLPATIKVLVNDSEYGYFARELDGLLHTETKAALLKLVRSKQICREKVSGLQLYCSADSETGPRQIRARRIVQSDSLVGAALEVPQQSRDKLLAALAEFFTLLDERQRRLYAGFESLRRGYGGDIAVARLLGMDVHTVSEGPSRTSAREY